MFPKSKVIYSTLLPRADSSLHTLSKINMKLIDRCSTLPNVHLVGHENIFSKGLDTLHDNKHLKKRHLGLFAANLVAAIRGRAKPSRSAPSQLHRSSPSSSRSLYTTPLEHHAFPSNAVNSDQNRASPTPESQQQPPPLPPPYTSSLEGYSSYSNAVKNGHLRTDRIYHPSQTQQQQRNPLHFHLQNGPPPTMHPTKHLEPNSSASLRNDESGASNTSGVEMPKEVVSFLQFIKTLL